MSEEMLYFILFLGWSLTGFIFIGVALYTKRYQRKKEINETSLATGRIVDCVEKKHHSGRGGIVRYYIPMVEFSANNTEYKLENENGSRKREDIIIGKSVDILYDPNDPTHFHLTEDDANEKSSNSLFRFGLMLILGAAVLDAICYAFHVF